MRGGKLGFDLDLNTASRLFRMNRHTVNGRAQACLGAGCLPKWPTAAREGSEQGLLHSPSGL